MVTPYGTFVLLMVGVSPQYFTHIFHKNPECQFFTDLTETFFSVKIFGRIPVVKRCELCSKFCRILLENMGEIKIR